MCDFCKYVYLFFKKPLKLLFTDSLMMDGSPKAISEL